MRRRRHDRPYRSRPVSPEELDYNNSLRASESLPSFRPNLYSDSDFESCPAERILREKYLEEQILKRNRKPRKRWDLDPPRKHWEYDKDVESEDFDDLNHERRIRWQDTEEKFDIDDYLILPSDDEQLRYRPRFVESFDRDELPISVYQNQTIMRGLGDSADTISPRNNEEGTSKQAMIQQSQNTAPDPAIRQFWSESIDVHEMNAIEQSDMLHLRTMLGIDRIKLETLSRFNVRAHSDSYDQMAIMYPRYRGPSSRMRPPQGLKLIRRIGDKLEKENYPDELEGKRFSGIFGYHMMTGSDRKVILTTNERDALAVYEATGGMLTFALPQGEHLDMDVIPFLEEFDVIYLWFPQRHTEFAKDFAHVLNPTRCLLIKCPDRPIELLRNDQKKEINHIIREQASRMRETGFRSMLDIRDEVRNELLNSKTRTAGLCQWKRFDALNRYLIGFRPAELTVLTGGTGYGKTTFLCEYALDLLTQGIRTLFCSFEMPEEKILKWMLVQYAGPSHLRSLARSRTYSSGIKIPLHRVEHHPSVEAWLDRFERTKGAMTIMKSEEFRDKTINQIAGAIKNEIANSGVQHVVIDNLQFLVGLATLHDEKTTSHDRASMQDRFVGLIRRIATDYGVHVTMVVHPRKNESETSEMEAPMLGGSSRVLQEADNVLVIVRRRDEGKKASNYRKFLRIVKNRYGGRKAEGDTLEMLFQPATYSHTLIDLSLR
ncbi:unnamed protein product, partial [Mesorhabditis belari]|uniref:SF4 helicase domain-containing protein n=1 Tax=Mesorhabditis belari TaxID=2138241 RepID=A0AAF3EYY4_9BILA